MKREREQGWSWRGKLCPCQGVRVLGHPEASTSSRRAPLAFLRDFAPLPPGSPVARSPQSASPPGPPALSSPVPSPSLVLGRRPPVPRSPAHLSWSWLTTPPGPRLLQLSLTMAPSSAGGAARDAGGAAALPCTQAPWRRAGVVCAIVRRTVSKQEVFVQRVLGSHGLHYCCCSIAPCVLSPITCGCSKGRRDGGWCR